MRYAPYFISVLLFLSLFYESFAWDGKAHQMIAQIAFHYLNDSDKARLTNDLGTTTLNQASVWLDEMKTNPAYAGTAFWHFVYFPKGTTYKPTSQINAVNAVLHAGEELATQKKLPHGRTLFDLFIILNLAGDLHQPLYTGYAEDDGGSKYPVEYLGEKMSLRKVWDSAMIHDQNIDLEECLALADSLQADPRATSPHVLDWLADTRLLTPLCYASGHKIEQPYIDSITPVLRKQLALAGLRLAALLHQIFEGKAPFNAQAPVASATKLTATKKEVPVEDIIKYKDQTVRVCSHVYRVKQVINFPNQPTYINLGAAYPDSPLTLLIWQNVLDTFSYDPEEELTEKNVCVTGRVAIYKGKGLITITKESQIEIK